MKFYLKLNLVHILAIICFVHQTWAVKSPTSLFSSVKNIRNLISQYSNTYSPEKPFQLSEINDHGEEDEEGSESVNMAPKI